MAEKENFHTSINIQDDRSDRSNDQSAIVPATYDHDHSLSKINDRSGINTGITNPNVSLESFAHLNVKKILWKIDVRILSMLTILYLLCYLDRSNIGNAKIEGLSEDLHLTGSQYNWALTAFFFPYCTFEVPSNMMLKRFRPSIWLPTIMIAWGVVTTLLGVVQNFSGLVAARFFLGLAEAGLFPGVAYYLTAWYPRYDVQVRLAVFFSAASIAGAFSGLLAYGISFMDGIAGLAGWRWIFILEGILTVVVAIGAYFTIQDFPDTAAFLSEEERAFVLFRLKYYSGYSHDHIAGTHQSHATVPVDKVKWKYVKDALRDWQIWVNLIVYWGFNCPIYGVSLFLPTIIKDLGYTNTTAQLLTVPVYVAAAITTILVAWFADRKKIRSPFIIVALFVQLIGFIMCISTGHAGVTYAGIFIAACAMYPTLPSDIIWLGNNLEGSYKRAVGMAIQIGLGNFAGAATSNFYRATDAPRYILGHGLEIGFISLGIIAAFIQVFTYRRINSKRERQLAAHEHAGYTPEELSDLGDKAITFRYAL